MCWGDHRRRPRRRPRRGDLLVVAVTAATVVPILVAGIRAAARGWLPTGDDALIGVRSWDVLTTHPPLLGLGSSASIYTHRWFNQPGPLPFISVALPVRVFGVGTGLAIGTSLVNALCVIAVAWLARRRGGTTAAVLAILGVALLALTLGSEALYDPWTQSSPLFPFTVFLFAVWGVADGDVVTLPFAVVAGSFAFQSHLSYVLVVPIVAVASLAAFAAVIVRRRRDRADEWPALRSQVKRWSSASLALLLACWALPLYEQATRNPGNMSALWASVGITPPAVPGIRGALQVVGAVVAIPPAWLPGSLSRPTFDNFGGGHPIGLVIAALTILAAIALVLVWQRLQRQDRTAAVAIGVALVSIVVAVASAARANAAQGLLVNYLWWVWPIGMFTWFAITLAVTRAAGAAIQAHSTTSAARDGTTTLPPRAVRRSLLAAATVATVVIAALTLPTTDNRRGNPSWGVAATRDLTATSLAQLHASGTLLVRFTGGFAPLWVGPGVLAQMTQHGIPFVIDDMATVRQVGDFRRYNGHNADATLTVLGKPCDTAPPPGTTQIACAPGMSPPQRAELTLLGDQFASRIRQLGGVPLTARGRRALTAPIGDQFRDMLDGLAQGPNALSYLDWYLLANGNYIDAAKLAPFNFDRYDALRTADMNEGAGVALLLQR